VRHDDEACDDGGPADDDQRRFKQAGEQDRYRLQMLSVKIALSQQYRSLIRFSRSPALSVSWTSTRWTRTPTRKSEISSQCGASIMGPFFRRLEAAVVHVMV